jgi:hypothetical protein
MRSGPSCFSLECYHGARVESLIAYFVHVLIIGIVTLCDIMPLSPLLDYCKEGRLATHTLLYVHQL